MNCKLCNSQTNNLFSKTILSKYQANYFQCTKCRFIFTINNSWLQEAYSNAITSLDIGLVNRNIRMLNAIPRILDACFPESNVLLDYAGGYGMFARLMRDEGYNFFRQDIYCENIFAKHFDIIDSGLTKFDVVTAFEVFEHFENPIEEIEKIFSYSTNVIFTTELVPDNSSELENWWYLSTDTGQHIAFYSEKSFQFLADKYGLNYYHKGNLHLFTTLKLSNNQIDYALNGNNYSTRFFGLIKQFYTFKKSKASLLNQDYKYIQSKIQIEENHDG